MDVDPLKVIEKLKNQIAELSLEKAVLSAAVSQAEERIVELEAEIPKS